MVKRIEKVIQQLDKNTNELDSVKKINITINSENFDKKIIEIPILVNHTVSATDGGNGGGIGG